MAFGTMPSNRHTQPVAEINMIPLIDVMLVLLIIFIITAPLMTHAVKVKLPTASSEVHIAPKDAIQLSINANGATFWNGREVSDAERQILMAKAASQQPQPELHIRADSAIAYQRVATVMSEAARSGLSKIGFITNPKTNQ